MKSTLKAFFIVSAISFCSLSVKAQTTSDSSMSRPHSSPKQWPDSTHKSKPDTTSKNYKMYRDSLNRGGYHRHYNDSLPKSKTMKDTIK